MEELIIEAKIDKLDEVLEFVNRILEANEVPMKATMQIDIAVEEVFVNIAHYAYDKDNGMATIRADILNDPKAVSFTFIDEGMAYNPLEKKDPDVTLSAEDRQIGGLGIYMVKKTMDDVKYEYIDGKNSLTISKCF